MKVFLQAYDLGTSGNRDVLLDRLRKYAANKDEWKTWVKYNSPGGLRDIFLLTMQSISTCSNSNPSERDWHPRKLTVGQTDQGTVWQGLEGS